MLFASLFYSRKFKKASFSVVAPKDWTLLESIKKDNSKYVKMYAPTNDTNSSLVENINIGVMHYTRLDDYIKKLFDNIKSEATYFKEKANGLIIINTYKMKWNQYLVQPDKNSHLAEQKTYFIGYKGNVFQIVCTAKPGEIKNMQEKIDTVLTSFKIL